MQSVVSINVMVHSENAGKVGADRGTSYSGSYRLTWLLRKVSKHDVKTIDTLSQKTRGSVNKIGSSDRGGLERRVIGRCVDPFAQRFEQLPCILCAIFTTRHRYDKRVQLSRDLRCLHQGISRPGYFITRYIHQCVV